MPVTDIKCATSRSTRASCVSASKISAFFSTEVAVQNEHAEDRPSFRFNLITFYRVKGPSLFPPLNHEAANTHLVQQSRSNPLPRLKGVPGSSVPLPHTLFRICGKKIARTNQRGGVSDTSPDGGLRGRTSVYSLAASGTHGAGRRAPLCDGPLGRCFVPVFLGSARGALLFRGEERATGWWKTARQACFISDA